MRPQPGIVSAAAPGLIAIVTGATDNTLYGSQELIRILQEKGIPHRSHVWEAPYGHDWPWWKEQIRSYIP